MEEITIGDIVVNEYNHIGELIEVNGNEAQVSVFNYGLKNDIDYCDFYKLRHCSAKEVESAKHDGAKSSAERKIQKYVFRETNGMCIGDVREILSNIIHTICNNE